MTKKSFPEAYVARSIRWNQRWHRLLRQAADHPRRQLHGAPFMTVMAFRDYGLGTFWGSCEEPKFTLNHNAYDLLAKWDQRHPNGNRRSA